MTGGNVADFVDNLPANGRYSFSRIELTKTFDKSDAAIKLALHRLQKKGRIISPRRGFYVVVPEEYKLTGAPPPIWFIDALMNGWHSDYYVGLLSAAEIHGAAHQRTSRTASVAAPMWCCARLKYRGTEIDFFKKWNVKDAPTQQQKTPTRYMRISTPEATALDLVRYYEHVGYYGNVVTVLSELSKKINAQRLVAASKAGVELAVVQRLGYFDLVGKPKLVEPLHEWLSTKSVRVTPLRTDVDTKDSPVDRRWSLQVNEEIEVEV